MIVGILAGLGTGAMWGLTFVAPRAVEPFGALDLAFARYLVFGLASLALLALPAFRPVRLRPRTALVGLALGGVGYVAYFVAVAHAVRLAGPAIPPLIIGMLPVVLGIIGNVHERAVPLRRLAAPLGLVAAGLVIVNAGVFAAPGRDEQVGEIVAGIAYSSAALLIWVGYAVVNARVTRSPDAPGSLPWTGLQGLGAGLGAIVLVPFLGDMMPVASLDDPQTARFLGWSLVLGLAGSWLATWFWVVASRRLPLALSAQLIVAETLFGLLYGFLYEARWPDVAEALGAGLQIVGVVLAIETFRRAARVDRALSGRSPGPTAPSP